MVSGSAEGCKIKMVVVGVGLVVCLEPKVLHAFRIYRGMLNKDGCSRCSFGGLFVGDSAAWFQDLQRDVK